MKTKLMVLGVLAVCSAAFAEDRFLVIDVSGGKDAAEYPVEKLANAPSGGWGDEYKTDKIVLSKVSEGSKEFYIGVFEITQRQWEHVTGARPSYYKNESCYMKRPVENVSYDDIRGKDKGSAYPESNEVDSGSFIGLLRSKAKLEKLDLPTEEQWRIACSASIRDSGGEDLQMIAKQARFGVNPGFYLEPPAATPECDANNGTAEVGSYAPNDRGLYDMYGNVCEWCLDICDVSNAYVVDLGCTWSEFRPFGKIRVLKGGHCECKATGCFSSIVYGATASSGGRGVKGFRIVNN